MNIKWLNQHFKTAAKGQAKRYNLRRRSISVALSSAVKKPMFVLGTLSTLVLQPFLAGQVMAGPQGGNVTHGDVDISQAGDLPLSINTAMP